MAKKKKQQHDVPRPELQNTSNVDTDVFVKGMQKDSDVALTGKENWTHAVNAINNSAKGDAGTIGNEPANIQCGSIAYAVIGTIHLYGDKWAIFTTDDVNSEIGIFDDSQCKYEVIVNDPCLNFNRRYLITGASKESFECQWWVYWDDGINPSRALNLDDVPWKQDDGTQDGDCVIYDDEVPRELDCERIRLNPLIDVPCIKLTKAKDGGQLQNGSYEAYIAYVVDDNTVTDYYKSNIQTLWDHQDNAGSLDIDIENLDTQFESYQLVIYTNAGMNPYAVVVGTYSTEQTHINLDMIDMSSSNPGLIKSLPLTTPVFERSEKMYAVNDYLLRQGPTTDFDFNYQCKANNINVKWVSVAYPSDYYIKGGNKPTFMRDEQYSFFIRFVYNTGNRSSSYHIPGRDAVGIPANDMGAPPDPAQVLPDEAGFPNWQVNNTSFQTMSIDAAGGENIGTYTDDGGLIVAKGWMGYWESTERYPNNPTVWCDLCNTPIRHHKFPEEDTSIWTQRNTPNNQWIFVLGVDFDNIEWPTRTREDGVEVAIPNIVGYEILVGSRQGNKSIIAKGLARNMRRYNIQTPQGLGQSSGVIDAQGSFGGVMQGLMPNYPFNDLQRDPYLSQQEVIRQGDYVAYGANFTTHNVFTFHSPETSFDRPFLNPSEIKSYGVAGGYSLGRFKRSEDHPKHKLIRDIAALIAAVIGAGYAIMEMRGEKVQKTKGSKALSIGKDPGPYAQSDAFLDTSTIDTTAGTGGTGTGGFFGGTGTGGTGGTANVNMNVANDSGLGGVNPAAADGDGITNQDTQQINLTVPPGGSAVPLPVGTTVDGGGAAPGIAGNITITDPAALPIPGIGSMLPSGPPGNYVVTYTGGVSQSQMNAFENMQQFNAGQDASASATSLPGQEGQEGSGAVSSSNINILSGFDINDITTAFQPTQESQFALSTTPIGDATDLLFTGTLPNSISGAEEDFLHDIKQKSDNAAMNAPGYEGASRDVEMKGSKYKSLPGFLQIMFKTYSFLNFMVEGGEGILELIYEFMNPQDYAYKYNSHGVYSGNFAPVAGNRYRTECERARYVSSAFQNLGSLWKINNLHRPKTVVIQGNQNLHDPTNVWADNSKFVLGELPQWMLQNPTTPLTSQISAHYVGLKYRIDNQYGQIQGIRQIPVSCVSNFKNAVLPTDIPTGNIDLTIPGLGIFNVPAPEPNALICTNCDDHVFEQENRFRTEVVFGGDAFINRYSEKVIMPFFWDFLKGEPDGYTYDYRLHQNVPFVRFWYNSAKYELSGLVRPITDLSFQWLSNPNDPGLPSALHNLDRLGSGTYAPDDEPGVFTGVAAGWMVDDDFATTQAEGTSGVSSLLTSGTGWASGTTGTTTFTGTTDTSGDSTSQVNSNWASSGGQATKSNGVFTVKNAFCYLHSSGINEFFVESELNMAQRDWDDKPNARHYDWQEFTDVNALFHADIIKDGNFYKFDRSLMFKNLASQLLSYGFVQPLSYDPIIAAECMTHYPKRIMYSLQAQDEIKKDYWRVFLPYNKEDFKDPVTTIKPINKTGALILFPHRAPQMWQGVDTLQTEGNLKVTIGDGGLFQAARQNIANADLPHEYASCESMRSVINTPSGAYFISQAQGKIFNYTGQLENIADRGMKQWFNTFLPSRLLSEFPEMEGHVDADNPVVGIGTQSVYDPNFDLVYFMKKDYALCDQDACVEYDPDQGFVVNLTECEGREQIATCPDGFTLYEAGEIHPSTGEVLTEATCCDITSETFQEFTNAEFDCAWIDIIQPIEAFDVLPTSDKTQTKDHSKTVVFEIPSNVFDDIKKYKSKKMKMDLPFLNDERLEIQLEKFSVLTKSFKAYVEDKDGARRVPYVPRLKTYKVTGKKLNEDGLEIKFSGIILIKNNILQGTINMPGKIYDIRKLKDEKDTYVLWDKENELNKPNVSITCGTEDELSNESRSAIKTSVERNIAQQRVANNDICINIAMLIPYGFNNEVFEMETGEVQWYAVQDYAVAVVASTAVIYEQDLGITVNLFYMHMWNDASVCPFEGLSQTFAPYLTLTRNLFQDEQLFIDQTYDIRSVACTLDTRLPGGMAYAYSICEDEFGCFVAGNGNWGIGVQPEDTPFEYVSPAESLIVKVFAHELGHTCGALHTHQCNQQVNYEFDPMINFLGGQVDICGTIYLNMPSYVDPPWSENDINTEFTDFPNDLCWMPFYQGDPTTENMFSSAYDMDNNTTYDFGTIMSYCANLDLRTSFDIPHGLQFSPVIKTQSIFPYMADTLTSLETQSDVDSVWGSSIQYDKLMPSCLQCEEDPIEVSCGSNDDIQDWIDENINYVEGNPFVNDATNLPPVTVTSYCGWCETGSLGIFENALDGYENAADYCVCCDEYIPCNEEIFLTIDSGDFLATFGFTITQLVSYILTGDSGNYNTEFNLINYFENVPVAGINLPNFLGINTSTYGVENLNDLLNWFSVTQDCNLELTIPQDIVELGLGGEVYWSQTGGNANLNGINIDQITDMTANQTMCSVIRECNPSIIDPDDDDDNGDDNGGDDWTEENCECFCPDGYNLVLNDPPNYTPASSPEDCDITLQEDIIPMQFRSCGSTGGEGSDEDLFVTNPNFDGPVGMHRTPDPWVECMGGPESWESPDGATLLDFPVGVWCGIQQTPDTNDGVNTQGIDSFGNMNDLPYQGPLTANSPNGAMDSGTFVGFYANAPNNLGVDYMIGGSLADVGSGNPFNTLNGGPGGQYREGACQQLLDSSGNPSSMIAGNAYSGSIRLAQAGETPTLYPADSSETPVELEIWGGMGPCCGPGGSVANANGWGDPWTGNYFNEAAVPPGNPADRDDELLWSSGDVAAQAGGVDLWMNFNYSFTPNDNWTWILIRVKIPNGTTVSSGTPPYDIVYMSYRDGFWDNPSPDGTTQTPYLLVDDFQPPSIIPTECCYCPEPYTMVLDDGIYQTPVSQGDCDKEITNNAQISVNSGWSAGSDDTFDVVCAKFEYEIGNVTCLNEWTEVDGSCVDPEYTDEVVQIELTDETYFKDVSWTVSYDPKIKGWISFHDWHPELAISSLNHFMTTKSETVEDPICPPGYEYNEEEEACCMSLASNSLANVEVIYGWFNYTPGGWGGPGLEFEEGSTFVTNPDFECPGGGFGCTGWTVTPWPWENGMMGTLDPNAGVNNSSQTPCPTMDTPVDCRDYCCLVNQSECGFTPDTHPIAGSTTLPANSGDTYIGLVHDCSSTTVCGGSCQECWWQETASQRLLDQNGDPTTLEAGIEYTGSIFLTQMSEISQYLNCFNDGDPNTGVAGRIELWGGTDQPANQFENYRGSQFGYDGNNSVGDDELLWDSGPVYEVDNWTEYFYSFVPNEAWEWIVIKIQMMAYDDSEPETECSCSVYIAVDGFTPPQPEWIDPVCECEPDYEMVDSAGNLTDECHEDNQCVSTRCECPPEGDAGGTYVYQDGDCDSYSEYIGVETNPNPLTCYYDGILCTPASYIQGSIWRHNVRCDLFANYYGIQYPWEIELVESVGQTVNTLRSIEYEMEAYTYVRPMDDFGEGYAICGYTNTTVPGSGEPPGPGWTNELDQHADCTDRYHVLDFNFNWAYIYNTEQVSGNLHLNLKPKNDAPAINNFPQSFEDLNDPRNSRHEILYEKVEQKYRFNQFWDSTKNRGEIILPTGNFDSNGIASTFPPLRTDLNGYDQWLTPYNIDYFKDPLQRKKFRHYWNKVVLQRKPIEIDENAWNIANPDTPWNTYDPDGLAVAPEFVKMLLKLDNAKINVSFR